MTRAGALCKTPVMEHGAVRGRGLIRLSVIKRTGCARGGPAPTTIWEVVEIKPLNTRCPAAFLYYFLQFTDSSFKERPIRRVEFRQIESKRPGSQNLSSIGNRIVGIAVLIFDINSGPYRNRRRYLAPERLPSAVGGPIVLRAVDIYDT
ncbi:hypothetical protein EVAR_95661_1 [Eumeta japonica]|uniref:Uncharacterized protein n=1 Tax=Eumeta variegata TaxID=151549 RepID=A0A4C1VKI1_EUMVA|nr:hypothetical protein EVAR_95661_1 [Eumeta japonica]